MEEEERKGEEKGAGVQTVTVFLANVAINITFVLQFNACIIDWGLRAY